MSIRGSAIRAVTFAASIRTIRPMIPIVPIPVPTIMIAVASLILFLTISYRYAPRGQGSMGLQDTQTLAPTRTYS